MDRIKDLANEKSNVIDRTILFPSTSADQVLLRHMLAWLLFPEHLAPAIEIGPLMVRNIHPTSIYWNYL